MQLKYSEDENLRSKCLLQSVCCLLMYFHTKASYGRQELSTALLARSFVMVNSLLSVLVPLHMYECVLKCEICVLCYCAL